MHIIYRIILLLVISLISACSDSSFNNPYPATEDGRNIYYDTFSERPKHLDPARSYSSNEYVFLGQIYESPLQYHFLKRPYELIPLTATEMPVAIYQDNEGNIIDEDTDTENIARVIYRIKIQSGVMYQPHPALATGKMDEYVYHNLTEKDLKGIHTLNDFNETGTRELTAADYIYQIKRMAHPKIHSPIAGLMSQYILGLSELSKQLEEESKTSGKESSTLIDLREYDFEGARVIDDTTFEIILKEKYPQFLYWLSMSFFAPMPWEADVFYSQAGMSDRNITLDWYPIGTGPFMLSENNPNRRMVLEKNPNFRGETFPEEGEDTDAAHGLLEDSGKVMPFVDKAIFSLEKESIPSWNKFLQGYYDTSGIVSDSFDQAVQFNTQGEAALTEEMQDKEIQLLTAVTTSVYYTGFNMRDEVIGGDSERARKLRQAIAIAVDFEEFISIFANGRGLSAQGPVPPGIFGNRKGASGINPYVYEWVNGKAKRQSINVAKKLMVEAGYPDGRHEETGKALLLYLDTPAAGPGSKANFDWLRKQFDKLGITLVIRATDYNRFQEKMLKGTAQIFQWGWNADYPDPENFLFLLYGPNAKFGINGENASNYKNEEFDQLFDQMKNISNGEARQSIIDQMVEIVRRDSPWLWGYHPVAFSLHHDWYKNAKPNLMANNKLKYKRIDSIKRKAQREQWNHPVWWPLVLILVLLCLSIIPAIRYHHRRERAAAL
jgi:oligopeptide transport system substrate-binding protein